MSNISIAKVINKLWITVTNLNTDPFGAETITIT